MQIIHLVLGKANPERMNGVNKVAHQLATTQHKLGYQVALWGIANSLEHNYPERNYKTVLYKQLSNKFILDHPLVEALTGLNDKSIVHLHGAFIPEFYHISRILKRYEIPYIVTPHGAFAQGAMKQNGLVKKWYFKLIESAIVKHAKAVQVLGKNEAQNLEEISNFNNGILIPNGQNLEEIPVYPAHGKRFDFPVFGFCGRMDINHKGLDLLMEGFKIYLERGNQGRIELIGDGSDRIKLEAQIQALNIQEHIHFHGKQFGKEKFDRLSGMDFFLHTSRMEGFPTAVLEAAALGIPCITSDATNINGYISKYDSGFPIMENDPAGIADQLENAAEYFYTQKTDYKGNNAKKMVQAEFTWENVAQQLIKVYQN